MHLLSRLPTRRYFVSLFLLVSVLFIIFGIVIYQRHQDDRTLNQLALRNTEVTRLSRRLLMDLVDMETGVRGYLLTGNPEFLEPYQYSQTHLNQHFQELTLLLQPDDSSDALMQTARAKIDGFSALLAFQIKQKQTHEKLTFLEQGLDSQRQNMDDLRVLFEGEIHNRMQQLKDEMAASQKQEKNFLITLIISVVLGIGSMLITTIVIIGLINRGHKAEQGRREAEDRFLTVMNGINDGLYDYDCLQDTAYYSPSYIHMLGYAEGEYPNTIGILDESLHPDDHDAVWDKMHKFKAGTAPHYVNTFRLRHKKGYWVWILSRGIGIRDAKGTLVRLIGTHTDISEQKKREEALEQLNTEMETFTYIASHDLRSPLVNIKGFAKEIETSINQLGDLLKNDLPEQNKKTINMIFQKDLPESLRFIFSAVERMDALTSAILNLSRVGKRHLTIEDISTGDIVQRCLDTLAYEIAQHNIDVICSPLPRLMSDSFAIEQIFSNILDNAVKYMDKGRAGKIEINCATATHAHLFSIKDNGRGIDDADRGKVFQAFRRARNTTDIRGLGMGMAFVQSTVRKLGGTIWFDSRREHGTTFYFTIPVIQAPIVQPQGVHAA